MSHIVKGKVTVAYKDETLLRKALETLGIVVENERLYVALGGGSYSKAAGNYDLVLVNKSNPKFRIGYRNETLNSGPKLWMKPLVSKSTMTEHWN